MDFLKRQWLSLLALIIAVAAIAIAYFRCDPLEANWSGVLVGVLAILVTALLCWNIYSLIEFRENIKEVKRIYYLTSARTKGGLADVYLHLLGVENEREFKLLQCLIEAIRYRSLIGDYSKCNKIIDTFLSHNIKWDSIKLSDELKKEVTGHLYDVNDTDKIGLWPKFKEEIIKIGTGISDNEKKV